MKGKNIWFTSDLHFGHEKAIFHSNRPFRSLEEMNEGLIKNWNKVVRNDDLVIVIGDFSMYAKKPELRGIVARLYGKKCLVLGNHDKTFTTMEWLNMGFDVVCENMTIKIANEIINISHYPYKKPWYVYRYYDFMNKLFPKKFFRPRRFPTELKNDGRFLLHGHTHSPFIQRDFNPRMIHVGVDANNYTPVNYSNIVSLIHKTKTEYEGRPTIMVKIWNMVKSFISSMK
jgi:calcineurin-like phosphoesterase family protein